MKTSKRTLWHSILTVVFTASLILGNLVLFMPTVSAANRSATSDTFTAEFSTDANAKTLQFMTITFSGPACGDPMCATAVTADDIAFTDGNTGTGFTAVSSCNHTVGSKYMVCVMDAVADATDTADSVYLKQGAVWGPDGGFVSGSQEAVNLAATADTTGPAGTVFIDTGTDTMLHIIIQFNEPVVNPTGGQLVFTDGTDIDYTDVSAGNAGPPAAGFQTTMMSGVTNFLVLQLSAAFNGATGNDLVDTIGIVDNRVYDIYGNEYTDPGGDYLPDSGGTVALATGNDGVDENPATAPAISAAYGKANVTSGPMLVEFDYPVNDVDGGAGALGSIETADIEYGTAAVEAVATHTAGDTMAILTDTTTTLTTIAAAAASIHDPWGNDMATSTFTVDDVSYPVPVYVGVNQFIDGCEEDESEAGTGKGDTYGNVADGEVTVVKSHTSVEAGAVYPQEGWGMYRMKETGAQYANNDGFAVDLDHNIYDYTNSLQEFTSVQFDIYYEDVGGDLSYTDGSNALAFYVDDDNTGLDDGDEVEWFIDASLTGNMAEDTWTTITVDIDGTPSAGTLAGLGAAPQYWGIKVTGAPNGSELDQNDVILVDNVKFIRESTSKSNELYVKYAEWVEGGTGDPVEDAAAVASNTNIGDMTTSKTIAGLGAFETGVLTTKTLTNTIFKEAATLYNGSVYTVTLANQSGGLITQASPSTLLATFTPEVTGGTDVTDKDGNEIEAGSTVEAAVGSALDLTTASSAVTDFVILSRKNQALGLSWTSPSQTAATFSHYVAVYGTSSGVSVASSLFDESDDATLATSSTESVDLTGLTNGTTYYVNLGAVDIKGNITSLATEMSSSPAGGSSGGGDSTGSGPAAPSSFEATVNEDLEVVLSWVDPSNIDLESIQIIRSFGEGVEPSSVLDSVNPDVETYTDTDVSEGDIVNYQLRGKDEDGAYGTVTETLTITVETGATTSVEDVVEEETAEEGAAEEGAAEEGAAEEGAAAAEGEGFTDVDGHWAEAEILAMQDVGIATGNPDGSFTPDGELNRAEAAALLYRVLGFDEPAAPATAPFPDVSVDAWYAGYVSNMKALEMIHGYGDGTYGPGNNITRAEFIKIALEVYYYIIGDEEIRAEIDAYMEGETTNEFRDLEEDWYTPYVTAAAEMDFVSGYTCGPGRCFGATNDITRAEATTMLYNMFYTLLTEAEAEEMVDDAAVEDDTAAEEETTYDCTEDLYNCSDYTTQAEAQAVYDYCMTEVETDVHALDADENGLACEELE